jgi:hypothetical protein
MATLVESGNKKVFKAPTPNSSTSRENTIIEKTKALAFDVGPVISHENFEHKGDRPAGSQNSIADMENLSGKELQESYRAGFPMSAAHMDKVSDR